MREAPRLQPGDQGGREHPLQDWPCQRVHIEQEPQDGHEGDSVQEGLDARRAEGLHGGLHAQRMMRLILPATAPSHRCPTTRTT